MLQAVVALPQVTVIGLEALAKAGWSGSKVERRCVPLVPTYPSSRTQFPPNWRCTVKFHCCVVGTIQCRGVARPKKPAAVPENDAAWVGSAVGCPALGPEATVKP